MKILYCRIGWMNAYKGIKDDSIINGGSYNENHIGHEIYNFKEYNKKYYGFVEDRGSIHIERLGCDKNDEKITGVTVVWVAKSKSDGQKIVGWYSEATVFRNRQKTPSQAVRTHDTDGINEYNVCSQNTTLVNESNRTYKIKGFGRSNLWYGNEKTNKDVLRYIANFTDKQQKAIKDITSSNLTGQEKEALIKIRINQSQFRNNLLIRYDKCCCLCKISNPKFLLASHIKPWCKSNAKEKLDTNNGLLLCPAHDKLFDGGFITFDDSGKIIISDDIENTDRKLLNINDKMKITVTDGNKEYLRYHREHEFEKWKK